MKKDTETHLTGILTDTSGVWQAPIKILKARATQKEYSNYRDVFLSYKNISNKRIKAIRFQWYGLNAFGEPADMGVMRGLGGGYSDDRMSPGQIQNGTWSVLSRDLDSVTLAWPTEVVYTDNTKWKLTN